MTEEIIKPDQEIEVQMKEAEIEALQKEISIFKENIEGIDKGVKNYVDQWSVDKEIMEIMIEGFTPISPKFKYEENPRFWELQKEKLKYKLRYEQFSTDGKLAEYERQKKEISTQLESAELKLKELQKTED